MAKQQADTRRNIRGSRSSRCCKELELSDSSPKNPPSGTFSIVYRGSPTKVAISPDGNTIVTANSDIQLWDIETGQQTHTIEGNFDWFQYVAISPDNKSLVSLNSDNTINLWDFLTNKKIWSIKESWVRSVAISPDGNTLVTGSWGDKTIKLWNLQTGKLTRAFEDTGVNNVAISPDGTILISSHGEIIKLRDILTGKVLQTLQGHSFSVNAIAISKNNVTLVSSSVGDEIILWDLHTGKLIRTLKENTVEIGNPESAISVTSITISPDSKTVVSGYVDGTIIFHFSIDKVIKIKVANQNFDLHNQFKLQGYNYNTPERVFELIFKGFVSWGMDEVNNLVMTDLKIIFINVSFLRIQDCPFHQDNVCFNQMQFVNEMIGQFPETVIQVENLFTTDEREPFEWEKYMYISFTWGVEILISSETVEVKFNQFNSLETPG